MRHLYSFYWGSLLQVSDGDFICTRIYKVKKWSLGDLYLKRLAISSFVMTDKMSFPSGV